MLSHVLSMPTTDIFFFFFFFFFCSYIDKVFRLYCTSSDVFWLLIFNMVFALVNVEDFAFSLDFPSPLPSTIPPPPPPPPTPPKKKKKKKKKKKNTFWSLRYEYSVLDNILACLCSVPLVHINFGYALSVCYQPKIIVINAKNIYKSLQTEYTEET